MTSVAIVGIGCRFPGADGAEAYWRLLASGTDAICEVPRDRWSVEDLHDDDPTAPGKMNTRWGGFLNGIDRFDAAFFGIAPREAAHIDPQQRLLMEVAWEALEDAGIPVETLRGQPVGVFVGMSSYDYGSQQLTRVGEIRDGYVNTGSALSVGANRLSYLFDFRGPSIVIDTACSSSLVAAYYACQSLTRGESRVALAGGVNLILSPAVTIGFSKLQAMAPDGRCKSFDARANGYVRGEGAGIVVLKPLANAVADGDRIYAVIRGGAVNQDGRTNGLTAPNGLSQEALLRDAFSNAGVRPSEIQYVEAHGTGTALGDPIELNALGAVLATGRSRDARCAVGSVKTNVGHLEAAAGVAGLIKLAMSLDRRQVPPSLHFEKPNPYIRFDVLPLRVVTGLEPWPADGGVARGGVSSFGFGGTNAHLILEEAPARIVRQRAGDDEACLLPISARSEQALASLARTYAARLADDEAKPSLVDMCATAALRRSHHDYRLAAVAAYRSEMAARLNAFADGQKERDVEAGRRIASRRRKVAFVFPGQGSQWLGMGRELVRREPVFANAIEKCAAAIAKQADWSLIDELHASTERSRLDEVDVIQPMLFAIEVALTELWQSWGIKPDAAVGHSMGEVAAAYAAGALSLDDAARIICRRSRLARQASGRGAMAVVELSLGKATEILAGYEDRLAVAVNNSPTSSVLSGAPDALDEVLARLEGDGVFCRRVKVDYASHSPQMDPLRDELRSLLEGVAPRKTVVPLYSTVTGSIAPGRDLGPEYWVRNLREPVLFAGVIEKLLEDGIDVFLEVSPHPILLPAVQQCLFHFQREGIALASLQREEGERRSLLSTLASLYATGTSVDWSAIYQPDGDWTRLPAYQWQRERFWFDDTNGQPGGKNRATSSAARRLIGDHIRSATESAAHVWQRELGVDAFPFLRDHRVQSEMVVPATCYLEMALEAARDALGDEASFTVEDVRFEKPLVLSEGDVCNVQVALTRQVPTRFDWRVFAETPNRATADGSAFARHAHGCIRVSTSEGQHTTTGDSLAAIRERCTTERSAADHYRSMAEVGLEYGAAFQSVEAIWTGKREAVARLKAPSSDARRYHMHPALLDSAFQILGAALSTDARTTLVPVSLGWFRLHKHDPQPGALWAHAVLKNNGSQPCGDVRVFSEGGALVAEAIGIGLAPIDGSSVSENAVFYSLTWEKRPAAARELEDTTATHVLIFADSTGVGARLAEQITARGGLPIVITRGRNDYAAILAELKHREVRFDSVIHLRSLDIEEAASDASALGWQSALLLTRALVETELEGSPRLWLVTREAQPVLEGDDVSPFRAPLWGLARTIAQEHPELRCSAIDLGADAGDSDAALLLNEMRLRDREQQVAFRGGERFVARLAPVDRAAIQTQKPSLSREGAVVRPFRAELTEAGSLSSVMFRQTARRRPSSGEVEIEVVAAGLNFRDILLGLGLLDDDVVLGHECAGRISAVGDGVKEWLVGDDVVALAKPSLSSFVRTRAELIAWKPARLAFEEAATLPIAFLTAHYALNELGRLQPQQRVLIHSATGAVGLACVRLAQAIGAEIYATAGNDEKRRLLESLRVRHAMDSRSLSFADEVLQLTKGEGVDVVVNSLAGEALARGLALLRPGGRFIELGKRDLLDGGQIPLRCLDDNRSFFLVDLDRLADKQPETCGRLLRDALRIFEDKKLRPLPKGVFAATNLADALDHMARARHVGKVVIRMDEGRISVAPPSDVAARVRDDATYVLTGGLGGIALVVARWLVEKGARNIVLVGRSKPSAQARTAITAMEQSSARVIVDRFDIADAAAVDAAFARWARDLPPLGGIMHLAGLLDDGILIQQTPERFHKVMAPKVDGAWNLHRASEGLSLDFFVLFSSAASVLGSAGQSNYAAANQFLDALCHYRRARKLPAVTINWGPWAEVGLVARLEHGARLESGGMKSLSPQQGIEALERILLGDVRQLSVISVDWREWRESHALLAEMPFFCALGGGVSERADAGDSLRARLRAAAPEERVAMLQEFLRQQLAGVLRLAAPRVHLDQPLVTMGIDSLMAVELKNRVERETGLAIPLLQLIKGPSIADLARALAGSMAGHAVSVQHREQTESSLLLSLLALKDGPRESRVQP